MNKIVYYAFLAAISVFAFLLLEYPKYERFNDGKMHMYFLDVGQGDASLIKLPSKKLILIDAGPGNKISSLISDQIPFSQNRIDLFIISHSHADHITGAIEVLDNYQIGCLVYDIQDGSNSETESRLRKVIDEKNVDVVSTYDIAYQSELSTDCFADKDVKIYLYSLRNIGKLDASELKRNQNLESSVAMIKYSKFEALFTGDAEAGVQSAILDILNENIEVLKVPHQGSFDAYYPPLLDKTMPDFAIFSVGEGNSYGHPHKEVLEAYKNSGIKFARTDENGTVHIETDGQKWRVALENSHTK